MGGGGGGYTCVDSGGPVQAPFELRFCGWLGSHGVFDNPSFQDAFTHQIVTRDAFTHKIWNSYRKKIGDMHKTLSSF